MKLASFVQTACFYMFCSLPQMFGGRVGLAPFRAFFTHESRYRGSAL